MTTISTISTTISTKIIQWSPPRSGSTLVWQILDKLFEDPTYTKNKWYYPNIVQKTHT